MRHLVIINYDLQMGHRVLRSVTHCQRRPAAKFQFIGLLQTIILASPFGRGAPVRTLGRRGHPLSHGLRRASSPIGRAKGAPAPVQKKSISYPYAEHILSIRLAPRQSLPLMREVDSPSGEDGGRENYPSVSLFG